MSYSESGVRRGRSALARLLADPRYEIIPVRGIEERLRGVPAGVTITVTASPSHGLDRTLDVSAMLAARGFHVVPHLAARMITGRGQLERLVERLGGAGVREVFVIGGDQTPPAGSYAAAGDILEELAGISHPFARVGIGGYPEGHPLISDEELLAALRRKQPFADHIVTQICFDPGALLRWVRAVRDAGIGLPILVGLPGAVARHKLAEISIRAGVGASLSYLRRHPRHVAALARTRRYDPTPLAAAIAAHIDDDDAPIEGVHLFTFNQLARTRDWVEHVERAA